MKLCRTLAVSMACLFGTYTDMANAFVVGGVGTGSDYQRANTNSKPWGVVGPPAHRGRASTGILDHEHRRQPVPSVVGHGRGYTSERSTSTALKDIFDEFEVREANMAKNKSGFVVATQTANNKVKVKVVLSHLKFTNKVFVEGISQGFQGRIGSCSIVHARTKTREGKRAAPSWSFVTIQLQYYCTE